MKDIVLLKSEIPEIKEINNKYLNLGNSIIDMDYSNYFMYQYYSLLYYIEDQEEAVRKNFRLDRTILIIKELSKNIIQKCQYFGNYFLLKDILDRYENLVNVITEYIYQYGVGNIDYNNYVPDDIIANEYDKLVKAYDNYISNIESTINTSYYSIMLNFSSEMMNNYMSESIDFSNELKNYFTNKILNEENPNNEHDLNKRTEINSLIEYSLYKRISDENKQLAGFSAFLVFGLLQEVITNYKISTIPEQENEQQRLAIERRYNFINSISSMFISLFLIILKTYFGNFLGQSDNTYLTAMSAASTAFNFYRNRKYFKINGNTNDNVSNELEQNTIEIIDLDITNSENGYIISYDENGETKKFRIKKDSMIKIISGNAEINSDNLSTVVNVGEVNGKNNDDESNVGEVDGNKNDDEWVIEENNSNNDGDSIVSNIGEGYKNQCRTEKNNGKRAVGKSNCNKKQLLRESVFTSENVKTTIKNNIGKLDDIDPDNGYKELTDSVEYSNYLSEAFENADDFSETSKFGEDVDSPISLEDLSNKMQKSAKSLKNNVETALSEDMLTKSKKRSKRHSNKAKNGITAKSPSKVMDASSRKEKID